MEPPQTVVTSTKPSLIQRIGAVFSRKFSIFNDYDGTLAEKLAEVMDENDDHRGDDDISADERNIFRKMLTVGDVTVSDIMVPRTDIVAIDYHITLTELKEVIAREQHTRMPVYDETLDTLKGFLHLKDLVPSLSGDEPYDMDELLRDVYFIAPSMKIIDLLMQMRVVGHHMAIIVDEYGGTDGLVTLEDVFEALVGEIQDEHDVGNPDVNCRRLSSHQFEIDARMRVDALQEEIGLDLREILEEEDYDTVGGFVFAYLHRVPVQGEIIDIPDIGTMKITEADPRRIRNVQLTLNYTPLSLAS